MQVAQKKKIDFMKYKNEVGYTLEDIYLHFTSKNIIPRK